MKATSLHFPNQVRTAFGVQRALLDENKRIYKGKNSGRVRKRLATTVANFAGLAVATREEVFRARVEGLGHRYEEAEGIGQAANHIEGEADGEGILDLSARRARGEDSSDVIRNHRVLAGQLAQHKERCAQRLGSGRIGGCGVELAQHYGDLLPASVGALRNRRMRFGTELALIGLRDKCRHEFPVCYRPGGWTAHCLMSYLRHRVAVEIGPVFNQLDDVEHRLTGGCPDERE